MYSTVMGIGYMVFSMGSMFHWNGFHAYLCRCSSYSCFLFCFSFFLDFDLREM